MESTWVTFPSSGVECEARVLAVHEVDDRAGVILDRSAYHPESLTWPDQGGDTGSLLADGRELPVEEARTGVWVDGRLLLERAALRLPGAVPVVVHLVRGEAPPVGSAVRALVDRARRDAVSRAHTGAHLASLALNAALSGAWRKAPSLDARGEPDFDRCAIAAARLFPDRSVDRYRLGRSLRKAGFDEGMLRGDLPRVASAIAGALDAWVQAGGAVRVEADGPLAERRTWIWQRSEGEVRIPCGGTHIRSLGELRAVTVQLSLPDAETLEVVTTTFAEECFTS